MSNEQVEALVEVLGSGLCRVADEIHLVHEAISKGGLSVEDWEALLHISDKSSKVAKRLAKLANTI